MGKSCEGKKRVEPEKGGPLRTPSIGQPLSGQSVQGTSCVPALTGLPWRTDVGRQQSLSIYFTGVCRGRAPADTRGTCASRPSSCPRRRGRGSSPRSTCSLGSSGDSLGAKPSLRAPHPTPGAARPARWARKPPLPPCPMPAPPQTSRLPARMPRAPAEARGHHSPSHEDAGAQEPGEHAWDRCGHGDDPVHAVWTCELYRVWGLQPWHPEQFLGEGHVRPYATPPSPPSYIQHGGPPQLQFLCAPLSPPGRPNGPSFPLALPTTHQPPGLRALAQLRPPAFISQAFVEE